MNLVIKNNKAIISNVLSKEDFEPLKKYWTDNSTPWYYNEGVVEENDGGFQFIHVVWDGNGRQSDAWNYILPILNIIEPNVLSRIKANLRTRTGSESKSEFHCDVWLPLSLTAIFYIDTNDGYTEWEDGDKVSSVENTLVVFPSNMPHLGTAPLNTNRRTVINFNYIPSTILSNSSVSISNKITEALTSPDQLDVIKNWAITQGTY